MVGLKKITSRQKTIKFNNKYLTYNVKDTRIPFTFTIDTNNIATTDYGISLSFQSSDLYDATVDWGDGTTSHIDSYDSLNRLHTYDTDGIYTIKILGRMDKMSLSVQGKESALISIDDWGNTNEFKSLSSLCSGCNNLISVAPISNLSDVEDIRYMFYECSSLQTLDLSNAYLPNVTSLSRILGLCSSLISVNFTDIYLPNLLDTSSMLSGCANLTDLININHLNVSKVTNMAAMFNYCQSLQTVDLTGWDTNNVLTINNMFDRCLELTTVIGIENFNLTNCTEASSVFSYTSIETIDLSLWNMISVVNIGRMFMRCGKLLSVNVSGWDVSNITTVESVFYENYLLTTITGIENWNISFNLKDASTTFYKCSSLTSIDLSNWDVSGVEKFGTTANAVFSIFSNCSSLQTIDLTGWSLSSILGGGVRGLFAGCSSLTTIHGITNLINNRVTDLISFFSTCKSLTQIDVSGWDTSNVDIFRSTFDSCTGFTSLDLSTWDTSKPGGTMIYMFRNCESLQTLNITGWDLSTKTIDTGGSGMFYNCEALQEITGISGTTLSPSNINISTLFYNCNSLNNLDLSNWDTSNIRTFSQTFSNCLSLTNLNITGWNFDSVNVTNAFGSFLINVTLDTTIYDNILINIASQNVMSGLSFNGGNSQYTSTSQSARDFLTVDKGWTISDGGLEV